MPNIDPKNLSFRVDSHIEVLQEQRRDVPVSLRTRTKSRISGDDASMELKGGPWVACNRVQGMIYLPASQAHKVPGRCLIS